MTAAVASVIALFAAIGISMFSRLNVGLIAIACAWLIGVYLAGMKPDAVLAGFPSGLFLTLTGVTLLFAVAQVNQTFEALTRALGSSLTDEVKARFKAVGVDLDVRLLPAYPLEIWLKSMEIAASLLLPNATREEQYFNLGHQIVGSYGETLIGRALIAMMRVKACSSRKASASPSAPPASHAGAAMSRARRSVRTVAA